MNKVKVKFFGAFRQHIPTGESQIEVIGKVSAKEFKDIIWMFLEKNVPGMKDRTLLDESVIANEDRILSDFDVIDGSSLIAVLPPVCGG